MADLPLLLPGPIVRRVESKSASVWVALRDPCSVELTLWEGDVTSTSDAGDLLATEQEPFDAASADTMRIGEKLHLETHSSYEAWQPCVSYLQSCFF